MNQQYLDHAATSMPKDARVIAAMVECLQTGATPDRGNHPGSRQGAQQVRLARQRCAALLGDVDEQGIVFTLNATDSLNLVIKGLLQPGQSVVTTQVEHNSVSRPLRGLQARMGLSIQVAPAASNGVVDAAEVLERVRPDTRLVVMSHASNVTGAIQPVAVVGAALRRDFPRARLLVDAAQSAGYRTLNDVADVADFIAAAGHKGPGGPLGTGLLWVRPGCRLTGFREGGTGTDSDRWRQPDELPVALEGGSPNLPGIAGLSEAVRIRLEEDGLENVAAQRRQAVGRFLAAAADLPGLQLFGPEQQREPVFPLRLSSYSVDEASVLLETHCGIEQRSGLHCSPGTHQALGTYPEGTLRLSFGAHVGAGDVSAAVEALQGVQDF